MNARRGLASWAPWEWWLLTGLALVTRLWQITSPPDLVWDERHYAYYVGAYLSGDWMMDVHPPLGRLLWTLVAWLVGYGPDLVTQEQGMPWVRIVPACAGAMLVPLVWAVARRLGVGRLGAALAALAVLTDTGLWAMSRVAVPDMLLLTALMGSLASALSAVQAPSPRASLWWTLLAAVCAGMAVGIKWTGLAAPALVFVIFAWATWTKQWPGWRLLQSLGIGVVVISAIYVGAFRLHVALLPNTGREIGWMSPAFEATRRGSPSYDPSAQLAFPAQFVEMHRVMLRMHSSVGEQGGGASSSPWYSWPLSQHTITLRSDLGDQGNAQRWMIVAGNPVVWWGALAAIVLAGVGLLAVARRNGTGNRWTAAIDARRPALCFLLIAYAVNLVPFMLIRRPMYLYHYLAALLMAIIALGVIVDVAATVYPRGARRIAIGVGSLAVLVAVYLAPMVYGWPIGKAAAEHRIAFVERRLSR